MARHLLLHIGPHKTGTTAIQNSLSENITTVKSNGWNYLDKLESGITLHQVADRFSQGRHEFQAEFRDALSGSAKNIIISSENFSRLGEEQISLLADWLEGFEITVVYYLRNPIDRLYSVWQERVKHGYSFSYPEFLLTRLDSGLSDADLNPAVRLGGWKKLSEKRAAHCQLKIYRYDKIQDISTHFMTEVIGLNQEGISNIRRSNQSVSIAALELYRLMPGYNRFIFQPQSSFRARLKELVTELQARLETSQNSVLDITMSFSNSDVLRIEKILTQDFVEMIYPDISGPTLFSKRKCKKPVVRSSFWINNTDLLTEVSKYRSSLYSTYGAPKIDKRLLRP
jgi:hypothetical protein